MAKPPLDYRHSRPGSSVARCKTVSFAQPATTSNLEHTAPSWSSHQAASSKEQPLENKDKGSWIQDFQKQRNAETIDGNRLRRMQPLETSEGNYHTIIIKTTSDPL